MKKIAKKILFPVFMGKIINSFPYVVAQLVQRYISGNLATSNWATRMEKSVSVAQLLAISHTTRWYHFWILAWLFLVYSVDQESLKKIFLTQW